VAIADVDRNKSTYILSVASDAAEIGASLSTSPESVVQAIFDAVKTGDLSFLKELCDPQGQNDSDTQMICDAATDETNREEFLQYFAIGGINGAVQISPGGDRAKAPFVFGPDGDQEETMELINRDGQWYLFGF
jgi:hypothetical protein